MGKTINLVEGYLPTQLQLQLVTSVTERDTSKGIENPTELVLVMIQPISPQEIFQNGSPISLLFLMWNI